MEDNIYSARTDLALEINEEASKKEGRVKSIIVEESHDKDKNIHVTKLVITGKNGEKILGRRKGTYITIEADDLCTAFDGENKKISSVIAENLSNLINNNLKDAKTLENAKVLVTGLGNRNFSADALGPKVVEKILITNPLSFSYEDEEDEPQNGICAISPGVMAQTGMETSDVIKGIVKVIKPDVIIVIDALAARNTKRLNRTVQISDKGINPGSGVGNHREGITDENIGIPVLAIGVPTVVDTTTIVSDVVYKFLDGYTDEEKYKFLKDVMTPEMMDMYVTPKEIDENINIISSIIAEAINMVFYHISR